MSSFGRLPVGASAPHYLTTLRRRKWWLIGMTILLPTIAVALSVKQHALYEAKAEVVVNRQNLAASLTGTPDTTAFQDPTRFVETQARIASIPEVAARALRAVGLTGRTADDLLSNSDVSAEPNVDLLAFKVQDPNRQLAQRLATAYANQFSQYRTELDTGALSRTLHDVRGRINQVEKQGGNSALLRSLINKEQQLQTLVSLQSANAFLVRPADVAQKVRPRPLLNGLIAGLLGLGVGLGLAFLVEAADTRVRSGEELVERLGLPLLGRIPEPPRRMRAKNELVMLSEPESVESESFRMLRTNVDFANLDSDAKVIMVTSAISGEGKSTTVANLAVSYARAGRKVLLAELDLRRPNLSSMLKTYPAAGLVDVLLGYAELGDAIRRIPIDAVSPGGNGRGAQGGHLDFLASGPAPADVGELFGSRRLEQLLDTLRKQADLVLLDAPPLLLVGDAMALSAQADALLLVSKPKIIRRPMLRELRRLLEASPTVKLGVVLTGDETMITGYSYAGYGAPEMSERRSMINVLRARRRNPPRPRERTRAR